MSALDICVELGEHTDIEFDEIGPREELNALRFDLRAARISSESYKAISLQAKEIADNVRREYERMNLELSALRAELAALRATVAAQATALEEAREIFVAVMPHLPISDEGYNTLHPARRAVDAWLASHAPTEKKENDAL